MVASKFRLALVPLLVVLMTPAHSQQNDQAGGQAGQPDQAEPRRGQAPPARAAPQQPPEITAARAAAAQRRFDAEMDIETLLERVAAGTGRQFLVDPRVRARVFTVPAIENLDYATLLSILRMHGYLAVEIGGQINILPDAIARSLPLRLLQRDDRNVPDDEWVTRVITVRNGNAAQLVPILRPMMPQPAHLAATADGKLVMVDTYANVRRITEVVETLTQ